MAWDLEIIRQKVRNLTGSPSTDQYTDEELNYRINNYYIFVMPFELKVQIANQFLQFNTTPGVDIYAFPGGYFTDQPGAYADGFPMIFYQDPDIFFQDWPQQYAVDNIATGDGITSAFAGGLQNPPLIIGTLFITADDPTGFQQLLQDNGDGTLSGNGTGTINYLTGAYTVNFNVANFNVAPASTADIYAKYQGYASNRPQGVLFFNNEFTLRPVPDQAYHILMQGYVVPAQLVNDSDMPLQEEWGPLIAYGTSLEIFSDRGDFDNYDRIFPHFKRFENVALGRTIQQYTAEQTVPRF
jgi:hypothetical protein